MDGEIRQIELIATPRRGADGEVTGTLGIFRDVTELHRLSTRLEQERSLLLSLIDNLPDYVYLKDRNSRFILANKAQALLVGASDSRELMGKSDHDFAPKEIADRYRDGDLEVMRRRKPIVNIEEPSVAIGGVQRRVLTTKVPIFDAEGEVTGIVGISRDITDLLRAEEERARLQDQLQQAQKMEAVGRLAGGIAHDFNNILTVITGYCEMALEESQGNPALRSNVEEIKRAAMRASSLIAQLLAFSRRQVLQPVTFDLGDLVAGMDGMLRRLLGDDVRLRTARSGPGLYVHADPGRIEQVIMNLAVNARDAMPGGGLLTIRTDARRPGAGRLRGARGRAAGRVRHPLRERHGPGDGRGDPGQAVRALLHDEGRRAGDGTGTGHRVRDCPPEQRADPVQQRDRQGNHVHRLPSARGGPVRRPSRQGERAP